MAEPKLQLLPALKLLILLLATNSIFSFHSVLSETFFEERFEGKTSCFALLFNNQSTLIFIFFVCSALWFRDLDEFVFVFVLWSRIRFRDMECSRARSSSLMFVIVLWKWNFWFRFFCCKSGESACVKKVTWILDVDFAGTCMSVIWMLCFLQLGGILGLLFGFCLVRLRFFLTLTRNTVFCGARWMEESLGLIWLEKKWRESWDFQTHGRKMVRRSRW